MDLVFKKIEKESFKDIAPYIDAMLPFISFLGDLYTIDIEGHHFVISNEGNKFIIVDNFNKNLNAFYLEFDDKGKVIKYTDELNEYEFSYEIDGNVRLVRSTDKLSKAIEQLVCFFPTEKEPIFYIDYYQCFTEEGCSAIFNYDIENRSKTVDSALGVMHFQKTKRIVLSQLAYFLKIFSYKKEQIFYDSNNYEMYRRAFIRLGENLFPEFNKQYPKDKVLYTLEDMGYKIKVPEKMGQLLSGKDSEFKRLELVSSEYKDKIFH